MKKKIIIIVSILIVAVFLTWQMFKLGEKECSLCLSFKGQRHCVSALGPTTAEAIEEGHRNACAVLASGVTEVLACNRVVPEEVQCEGENAETGDLVY